MNEGLIAFCLGLVTGTCYGLRVTSSVLGALTQEIVAQDCI